MTVTPNVMPGDSSEMTTTASICLVFDCSASMIGEKFSAAVETTKMIVDMLHERHLISLVAFQSESHIVFENASPIEGEKDTIKKQIDTLDSHLGGSTNMAAGIRSGIGVLSAGNADADIMVLLSDGAPNSARKAQRAADAASEKGIQFFAVGIGESYNANQLLRLVTPSNGAVFGDSEADKIHEIFYDLVSRFDRIIATNVKLNFAFDKRIQLKQVYKTSPERALYDSSIINSNDNMLELRVGNIENNKVYEFLLQLEVGKFDEGAIELIEARLQYDISHLGINMQVQEIILTVNFVKNDSPESATNKKIEDAIRSASMVQLCGDLVQACSKYDNDRALQVIDEIEHRCDEENNSALQQQLDSIKNQLEKGRHISDKDRNDFLLASTQTAPKAELFDLILIDPGSETIRLLREIRNATNMGLREIAAIIQRKNSVVMVFKNRDSAEKLQQRLMNFGAKLQVDTREVVEEDNDDSLGQIPKEVNEM